MADPLPPDSNAPMSPDEMRKILLAVGWSQGDLAVFARRDKSRTRKMARGAEDIDQPLARWLRRVYAAREAVVLVHSILNDVPDRSVSPLRLVTGTDVA